MRLESIARTRGDENPTAKGRGNGVHAQGEQQTLKPVPKGIKASQKDEMRVAGDSNRRDLNRSRNGPALKKKKGDWNVRCKVRS